MFQYQLQTIYIMTNLDDLQFPPVPITTIIQRRTQIHKLTYILSVDSFLYILNSDMYYIEL